MNKLLVAAVLVLMAGCRPYAEQSAREAASLPAGEAIGYPGGGALYVFHDNERAVTCYIYTGGRGNALSCLPTGKVQP